MVLFIQMTNGKVYFGDARHSSHSNLASCLLDENDEYYELLMQGVRVIGGGFADLEKKQVRGRSGTFGKYDADLLRKALPDWEIAD